MGRAVRSVMLVRRSPRSGIVMLCWCLLAAVTFGQPGEVRLDRLEGGWYRLQSRHLELITDLEPTEAIRELPAIFDAAMPQWADAFAVPTERWSGWRARAFLMGQRDRFRQPGWLTEELPPFLEGYQAEDRLFVSEQTTDYYRRHLLLHEGTHWFMWRLFGGGGPPWHSEGMAEWLSTHRWAAGELSLGVIPSGPDQVPGWGRLRLIHQGLAERRAPGLEEIMRYGPRAHLEVEPYAWSWAVVTFLQSHPRYAEQLRSQLQTPLDGSPQLTQQLYRALRDDWSLLRAEWQGFVSDLDFGYDAARSLVQLPRPPEAGENRLAMTGVSVRVAADAGWQSAAIWLEAGESVELSARGRYRLAPWPPTGLDGEPAPAARAAASSRQTQGGRQADRVRSAAAGRAAAAEPAEEEWWPCEPGGVTLRYYRGRPLGQLLATVAGPVETPQPHTERWEEMPVGLGSRLTASQAGWLLLKINVPAGQIGTGEGALEVDIRKTQN